MNNTPVIVIKNYHSRRIIYIADGGYIDSPITWFRKGRMYPQYHNFQSKFGTIVSRNILSKFFE